MLIQVLNGLVYGGLLYVLAVGLVLIFGLRRVVNFAHGGLFMIGSYVGFTLAAQGFFLGGLALAVITLAALGVLLDGVVFRPLQREDQIVTVLVTFGILLVLQDVVQSIWGKDFLTLKPPSYLAGSVAVFGSEFPLYRLFVIGIAIIVAAGLTIWLRTSRIGLYVRASSVDPVTTAIQGVDTNRVSAIVVAIGAALAGLSGMVAAPLMALSPSMGSYILIDSFIVVVVGGLGSFSGAFIAALLIGEIHNFGVVFVPWAATLIPFVLMVAVLIWRPVGAASAPAPASQFADRPVALGAAPVWFGAALLAGLALPWLVSSALFFTLMTQAVISALLALGVGFLVRQNGVVSFGHAVFFGLAAYTIALAAKYAALPAEAAIALALLIPTALAFLLGLVIVRSPGIAFSMLTLAVGQAFYEVAYRWRELANGDDGLAIRLPRHLFGLEIGFFQRPASMFAVCWIALIGALALLHCVSASHFGRLTAAIRENEERARFIGYATVGPRAAIYAMSAFVAALAGVLFALYNAFVSPDILHWSLSGSALIMAIIGGTRVLWGPILGAIVFFFFKDVASGYTEHWQAMIGASLIVVTVLLPSGLAGALHALVTRRGERREEPIRTRAPNASAEHENAQGSPPEAPRRHHAVQGDGPIRNGGSL